MKNINIQSRIDELCENIAQIKPLQNLIESFAKFEFVDMLGEKITPKIYLVGGAVRDIILEQKFKDYDFVVEGISKDQLNDFLLTVPGKLLDVESRNFGVFKIKLDDCDIDFIDIALPRLDVYEQYGLGHKDVKVKTHDQLTIHDDLSRRDFSINAMAINLNHKHLIDPFNGIKDLENKIIRAVGDPHDRLVKEDPTRILRALRFAAKYDFSIHKDIFEVIKNNHQEINTKFTQKYTNKKGKTRVRNIERVSRENIAAEFLKGFDANPEKMITLLDETGVYMEILPKNISQIWDGMKKTEQPINYHSEGNVWNHTILALKNINKLSCNNLGIPPYPTINLKLAILFHDMGKVDTFKIDECGNYTYYNHPQVSANLADQTLRSMYLKSPFNLDHPLHINPDEIKFIIENHMLAFGPEVENMRDSTIAKYYLQEIVPDDQDFTNPQTKIEMSSKGIGILQISFIDASSAIKAHGPQDYTGIKKMIAKIKDVKSRYEQFAKNRKLYPIDGNQIMKVLKKIGTKQNDNDLIYVGTHGGVLIGQLLDYILEDALQNPDRYKKGKPPAVYLEKIINNFLKNDKLFYSKYQI